MKWSRHVLVLGVTRVGSNLRIWKLYSVSIDSYFFLSVLSFKVSILKSPDKKVSFLNAFGFLELREKLRQAKFFIPVHDADQIQLQKHNCNRCSNQRQICSRKQSALI